MSKEKFELLKEEMRNKFFLYRRELVLALIIFLVASLSFGLGYLANYEFNRAPIIIEKCSN